MQFAKTIDRSAGLKQWKIQEYSTTLNGDEIRLINDHLLSKYIDIPGNPENFYHNKVYYQNGVHIQTNMPVTEFVERWNNKKYEKEIFNKYDWMPIKRAEMQHHDTAYAVGYFVGTSERGHYTTIESTIQNFTKTSAEVSYQYVNQQGVTGKVWNYARETAAQDYPNPQTKEHKKIKFKYAPSALVVYVPDASLIHTARRNLITAFGNLDDNGHWPIMSDGSRMRFVPIIKGFIKNKRVYSHLYDHLWLQSVSKAGEITFDLKMKDINTNKEYLKDQTLEQVLHGITSDTRKGVPIIKHISRKWSKSPNNEEYEIIVTSYMVNKATNLMRTIRNELVKEFGNEVTNHFQDSKYEQSTQPSIGHDVELEDFILGMCIKDDYTKVLIDGIDIVKEHQSNKKEQNQINDEQTSKTPTRTNKSKINDGFRTALSIKEGKSESTFRSSSDIEDILEQMTIAETVPGLIPLTDKEKRKALATIKKEGILPQEIEVWKNTYIDEYDKIAKYYKYNEYEIMKEIVRGIKIHQREQIDMSNEQDAIEKMINISREVEAEEATVYRALTQKEGKSTASLSSLGDDIYE